MMHIEFLVEEPSVEIVLNLLVPKILGVDVTFHVHVFQGKMDLLNNLEYRLKGYGAWLPSDWRIVVLVDEDRKDCHRLKRKMEIIAADAGLVTPSRAASGQAIQILNRIAIEELEAWFFGDIDAVMQAYPRLPRNLDRKARYRDPDAIRGGTCEALERILQ